MEMKVFVIVVTYNGNQWYQKCFDSLRDSEFPVSVVVVDNASSDDTVEYIKTNYPEIHLITSKINLGFGQGNNKGIRYALDNEADYVFLLNQDAWIEPNTIVELLRVHKNNNQFGVLSPMHINADKNSIEKGLMHYLANYKITDSSLFDDLYFNRLKEVYVTKYINAAAWLIHRNILETVGGFDPIYFHYGEDDDYMNRVHYHGYNIGVCPIVKVVHDTERREIKKRYKDETATKLILIKLTNINNNYKIKSFVLYNIRKAIQKAIKFEFNLSVDIFRNIFFVLSNKEHIKKSREQNIKKTSSWL